MNDLLGILIPLLMSGADIQTIFRELSGASGGASYDGLKDMMSRRFESFSYNNPLAPDKDLIRRHSSAFVDTIGVNPFKGFGQGLTDTISSMYNISPDVVGTLIGLPDSGSFYRQIANGSSGISVASGRGVPSIFNPYSARESFNNAVGMARRIHDLSTIEGMGFNLDYTHGLNMDEVGSVAQRLLSSRIPYMEYSRSGNGAIDYSNPTGNTLDTESKEFGDNLKELGSKFNEAASMLAKITGSVKDAIDLMDKLGGGNFLGGTADEALSVARKARNLASNIRVTSAMAGMDPREAYANMASMQQGLVSRYGISPVLAAASGMDSMMMDPAAKATMAYMNWAAINPNATSQEKMTAMAGAQGRVMQYANTSGENLAAMVSANKNRFSEDDLKAIETAYRMGRPDDIQNLVRQRMGESSYADYMNDPAAIQAFRLAGDKELQNRFANAAFEGNLRQAETEGAWRMMINDLNDTDRELNLVSGDSKYREVDRREASAQALRKMAVDNGMAKEFADTRNVEQLRAYLMDNGVDARVVERTENTAAIERQIEEIDNMTMSSEEESAAKERLKKAIGESGAYTEEKKKSMIASIDASGSDINKLYSRFLADTGSEFDKEMLGGKMSSAHAAQLKNRLVGHRQYWSVANTPEEIKRAVDFRVGRFSINNDAKLGATMAGKEFSEAKTDVDALDIYAQKANELRKSGMLSTEDNESLDKTYGEAARNVISGLMGSRIGNLNATDGKGNVDKDFGDLVSYISSEMMSGVKGGMSVGEAFASAASKITEDSEYGKKIGKEGIEQLGKWAEQAKDSSSDLVENVLNRKSIASAATTILNSNTSKALASASEKLFGLFEGNDKRSDYELTKTFNEQYSVLEAAGALGSIGENPDDRLRRGVSSVLSGIDGLKSVEGIDLSKISASAVEAYNKAGKKGDFGKATAGALRQAASAKGVTEEQKKALDSAADEVEKMQNVGQDVLKGALGAGAPDAFNKRLDAIRSALGTSDAQTATIAMIAARAEQMGVGFDQIDWVNEAGVSEDQVSDLLSTLDNTSAGRNRNALFKAINLGSGSFGREEVERSRKMIGDLRDKMEEVGISTDDIAKYSSATDEEKKNMRAEWGKKLGSATYKDDKGQVRNVFEDSGYAADMMASLVEKGNIGGIDAKKLLTDKTVDLKKVDNVALADVTKEAYKKDSVAYDILETLSKLTDDVSNLFKNPVKTVITGFENKAQGQQEKGLRSAVSQVTFGGG